MANGGLLTAVRPDGSGIVDGDTPGREVSSEAVGNGNADDANIKRTFPRQEDFDLQVGVKSTTGQLATGVSEGRLSHGVVLLMAGTRQCY